MTAVVVVVIVIGIAVLIGSVLLNEADQKRLREWAAAREWPIVDPPRGGPWLAVLPERGRGELRLELRARIDSAGGRPATVAWYTWTTTTRGTDLNGASTTQRRTHHATVYVTESPRSLPDLAIVHRGIGSSIARSLGLSGGADTGLADFDEHFRVDTDSGRDVVGLLPPELLEAMLEGSVPPWACRAGELVVWSEDRFDSERVDQMLPAVGRLVELIGSGQGEWRVRSNG